MTTAEVADKVLALIESDVVAVSGTIERKYVPRKKLELLKPEDGPLVTVVSASRKRTRISRKKYWQWTHEVAVALFKKIDDPETDGDYWSSFMDTLEEKIANQEPDPLLRLTELETSPIYAAEYLEKGTDLFVSVIKPSYIQHLRYQP